MGPGSEHFPPSSPKPESARRPWLRWTLAATLVLVVVVSYALGLHRSRTWEAVRGQLDTLEEWVGRNLLAAVVVFFVVYVAVTALSLPVAIVLTLVGGALFGRVLGSAVVSLASTAGATLAFLSSRYLFRDFVQRHWGGRLGPIERGIEKDGAYYLFTLRLMPLFPFFLVNLGMGLTRMQVSKFAWVSWLGMLPATVLYVNAGSAARNLRSPSDVLSLEMIVSLALLGLAPLALRLLSRWLRGKT